MKTKLSPIWQSLGVNAKVILMTILVVISVLLFFTILSLIIFALSNYIHYALIAFCLYLSYKLFRLTKKWLQQNKEN